MKTIESNVIYTDDNLNTMAALPDECVDLIYLDPPFNSGKRWENPVNATGKKFNASFKDTWTLQDVNDDDRFVLGMQHPDAKTIIEAFGSAFGGSYESYLTYMGARLVQMRRILKPTGSIYYHCNEAMSHAIKTLMHAIFGKSNFRNEIVWSYNSGGGSKKQFGQKHDTIFVYGKDARQSKHNIMREPYSAIIPAKNKHLFHADGKMMGSVWHIQRFSNADKKEKTGHPTQKPLELLKRIIKASSDEGDIVLDPFCGCATTCVAAELENRRWIGIDFAGYAVNLIVERAQKHIGEIDDVGNRFNLDKLRAKADAPPKVSRHIPNKEQLREELYEEQKGICPVTDEHTPLRYMHIDHLVSLERGGRNDRWNLHLVSGEGNSAKGGRKSLAEARVIVREQRERRAAKKYRDKMAERREKQMSEARK